MDDTFTGGRECVSKDVIKDGKTITVETIMIEENMWGLSIYGKEPLLTTWTEFFPTSEKAINAGMKAILLEGFEEFYSSTEFAYLDHF